MYGGCLRERKQAPSTGSSRPPRDVTHLWPPVWLGHVDVAVSEANWIADDRPPGVLGRGHACIGFGTDAQNALVAGGAQPLTQGLYLYKSLSLHS